MRSAGVGPRDACFLTAWGPPTCRLRGTDRWRCSAQGPEHKRTINVCTGTSCTDQGSKSTLEALKALTTGSEGRVCVQDCGCLNMCGEGPNVVDSRTRSVHKAVRDVRSMLHLLEGIEVPEDLVQALQYKEEGNRLLTGKRAREAKEAYRQALEHVPHGPGEEIQRLRISLLCNRAAAHMDLQEYEDAVTDCNDALDLYPGSASAWKRLGDAQSKLGDAESAVRAYETAAKLSPSSAKDMNNRIKAAKKGNKRFLFF